MSAFILSWSEGKTRLSVAICASASGIFLVKYTHLLGFTASPKAHHHPLAGPKLLTHKFHVFISILVNLAIHE